MNTSIVVRSKFVGEMSLQFTERRLRFALSRFTTKIRDVTLIIRDENGPRGGVDKCARIRINVIGGPAVVITEKDSSVDACVARAAERAGRAVARTIDRKRDFARIRSTDGLMTVTSNTA